MCVCDEKNCGLQRGRLGRRKVIPILISKGYDFQFLLLLPKNMDPKRKRR